MSALAVCGFWAHSGIQNVPWDIKPAKICKRSPLSAYLKPCKNR